MPWLLAALDLVALLDQQRLDGRVVVAAAVVVGALGVGDGGEVAVGIVLAGGAAVLVHRAAAVGAVNDVAFVAHQVVGEGVGVGVAVVAVLDDAVREDVACGVVAVGVGDGWDCGRFC